MESKDPIPWLYMRIADVDLGHEDVQAAEEDEPRRSLFWSATAVLLGASFAMTLACGPATNDGTAVAPMAVVRSKQGCEIVDGGVVTPGVAGDDTCTAGTTAAGAGTSKGTKATKATATAATGTTGNVTGPTGTTGNVTGPTGTKVTTPTATGPTHPTGTGTGPTTTAGVPPPTPDAGMIG
jgi:hypothetical protein